MTLEHKLREIFSDLLVAEEQEGKKILMSHFGTLSQDFINGLCTSVEEILISGGEIKKTVQRTFSVLIEGLQNIYLHGASDEIGNKTAFVFLSKDSQNINIVLGNLIKHEDGMVLKSHIDQINKLSHQELKLLYLDILEKNSYFISGGVGLGFLVIIMKSDSNLVYRLDKINSNLLAFSVTITLRRK